MRSLASVLVFASLLGAFCHAATTEPRTGLSFPDKLKRDALSKLGVRTKGPLKVYAVGLYGEKSFLLKMSMGVGAQKMSSALVDALKPRCQDCGENDIGDFESLLLSGLPDGAPKGTQLLFGTGGGKLTITIDEKDIGSVSSKALAKAFANIYTDENAVCQLKSVEEAEGSEDDDTLIPLLAAVAAIGISSVLFSIYNKNKARKIYVYELNIYPIKSCAAQEVQSAKPTARGFEGDRIAQVTDNKNKYCTPRDKDKAKLFHVCPELEGSRLKVTAPNMKETLELDISSGPTKEVMVEVIETPGKLPLEDYGPAAAKWIEEATSIPGCRLTGIGKSFDRKVRVNEAQGDPIPTREPAPVSLADEAPYLLTSTASLADLNHRLAGRGQERVDMRRFRPNIVVHGLEEWEEDCWRKIRINGVEFHVWQRCGRCTMTTIDRDTLKRGPEPLSTLSTFRERANGMRNFGMHLIPVEGTYDSDSKILLGAEVEVLEIDEERRSEWERNKD